MSLTMNLLWSLPFSCHFGVSPCIGSDFFFISSAIEDVPV